MTIYFVAGEVSADNHGAALMRSLRVLDPELKFIGRGGPQMQQVAGVQFKNWIGDAAVLGLWEVLRRYGYFREQFRQTLTEIQESKPDAVVLIDYPGFNLRLARALRRQSHRQKIIYYISPQVWAWNRGRIKKMARFIDLVLCIFPFETDLYAASGLRAVFVGHPMIERLETQKIDTHRDQNLIGLFPGSRSREVRKIFPVMIEAARRLLQLNPTMRFQVAAASEELAREMSEMLRAEQLADRETIEITVGQTATIMQRASVGIVASGSATLEAAYFGMPFVLIYKVAWPTYVAARLVVNVDFLGMPNLLAGKQVVPEFIQHEAKPDAIVEAVRLLMDDSPARDRMISDFDAIVGKLGGTGASERAAQAILEELQTGASFYNTMKIWDISRTLSNEFAEWPGDAPFRYRVTNEIAKGASVNLGAIAMSVHNGTHADARFHFEMNGAPIEKASLEIYLGRATVVDLSETFFQSTEKHLITREDLRPHAEEIAATSRLLVKTSQWSDSTVFPNRIPVIAADVPAWLQKNGVKLLGVDLPSMDEIDSKSLQNHHALARAGIAIIESLDLRDVAPGIYNFAALPLKIAGADGAPVRAVLWRD